MDAPENIITFPGLERGSMLVVVRGRGCFVQGGGDRGVSRVDTGLHLGKQASCRK